MPLQRLRITGKKWWRKQRFVALIPKREYDKYKVFTLADLPCDSCSQVLSKESKKAKTKDNLYIGYFTMKNMQVKPKFFNVSELKIRVPSEYVNPELKYYVGCDWNHRLKWETKRGKRKSLYYYSELPFWPYGLANITVKQKTCLSSPLKSDCDNSFVKYKEQLCPQPRTFQLLAEGSANFNSQNFSASVAFGAKIELEYLRFNAFAGIDQRLKFNANVGAQFHWFSFSSEILNLFKTWQSPTSSNLLYKYLRIYNGVKLDVGYLNSGSPFVQNSFTIGLARVNVKRHARMPRVYAEVGPAYDYLQNVSNSVYLNTRIGIVLNVASFPFGLK